ncbi:MAG: CAP domain-containing protein [Candidatus Altimarinota bacterium]
MALLNLFSQEPQPSPEAEQGLQSFPLIQKIRNSTHEKISHLLAPLTQIKGWLKKNLHHYLPGIFTDDKPEQKAAEKTPSPTPSSNQAPVPAPASAPELPAEVQQLFNTAQQAQEQEMKSMAEEFAGLANLYRKNAGIRELQPRDELHALAGQVADTQVQKGKLEHTTDEYRQKNSIHGEILVSGFSSAEEALQTFIDSADHYKNLMGDFTQFGYAIRPGIEKESGERMYFLAVVYRGGKPLENETQVPKKPLPTSASPEYKNLEDVFQQRPVLKSYFQALDGFIAATDPEVTYEFTNQVVPSEKERAKGSFAVVVKKGAKQAVYFVSHSPALLNRMEGDTLHQISFEHLLKDFSATPEKPASEKAPAKPSPTIPSAAELQQPFDLPSATKGIPEAEKVKEKEPEVVGLS